MTTDPRTNAEAPRHFGLLVFPQFELLDMAGPIECLNTLTHRGNDTLRLTTISASAGPVSTVLSPPNMSGGLFQQSMIADVSLDEARSLDLDVLIVPGGFGACAYMPPDFKTWNESLQPYLDFIAEVYPKLQYLFTVCNGAGLAARAGVLDGHRATTNKIAWKETTALGPKTRWVSRARWVESGKCWTTSGVSAGMDGMVALIAKIWGEDTAENCCRGMEYSRTRLSTNDPFAILEQTEDVPPSS